MKRYPAVPHVDDAPPGLLEGGHLWIQEFLDGDQLRFQLEPSGVVRFADSRRPFGDEVPLAYRHAVRHVRERLDRAALREAVEDVTSVVFVTEAMHHRSVPYEWNRTPSVLGLDVWDGDRERFLPPDVVERVYDRLGLEAVNAVRKEVRASDFDPSPDAIPASAWYDGPAAGIVLRNKTGDRAKLPNPALDLAPDPTPLEGTAEALAARYATDALIGRIVDEADADAAFDRLYEAILRAVHDRLTHRKTAVDPGEFRAAVAARLRAWQAERGAG